MLAQSQQSRTDQREAVMLNARVVDSRGSRGARISDVSTHGLRGSMAQPPERGEFITVHFDSCELGGQVRWVDGRRFGVRLRERVDARLLTGGGNARRRAGKKLEPVRIEEDTSMKGVIITYSVLGLTALSTAYLIVTYVIF